MPDEVNRIRILVWLASLLRIVYTYEKSCAIFQVGQCSLEMANVPDCIVIGWIVCSYMIHSLLNASAKQYLFCIHLSLRYYSIRVYIFIDDTLILLI